MQKLLTLKWIQILKALLLLPFSLAMIGLGLLLVIHGFMQMAFPWQGLLCLAIGLVAAPLALSYITEDERQLIRWLLLIYKALRLGFKVLLLLFGGWLLYVGSVCVISCGKYWENNWYLFVGAIVIGIGTIAHVLPFVPGLLRSILGTLMGIVLILSGGGFFLFMLWLEISQKSFNIEELPGLLVYMLVPLGVAWLGVRFVLAGYRFFISKNTGVQT